MLIAVAVVAGILTTIVVSSLVSVISIAVGNRGAAAMGKQSKTLRFLGGFVATASMIGLFTAPLIGLFVGITTGVTIAGV